MVSSNDVTITEGQARVLRSKLRQAWASGDCTAELDDAVRSLDEQIENLDRRPRPRADLEAAAKEAYPAMQPDEGEMTYPRSALHEFQRAAYIRGRLDQAEADAQIARSMSENEADGYYGQACYEIAAEIQKGVE